MKYTIESFCKIYINNNSLKAELNIQSLLMMLVSEICLGIVSNISGSSFLEYWDNDRYFPIT